MDEFLQEVSQFKPQEEASDMSHKPDVLLGSYRDQACQLLADTWITLHENAKAWVFTRPGSIQSEDRALFDVATKNSMSALQEVEVNIWESLCIGTGMTVFGAVALSWCKGAELDQVWEGWLASGFPLKPLPEFEDVVARIKSRSEHALLKTDFRRCAHRSGGQETSFC